MPSAVRPGQRDLIPCSSNPASRSPDASPATMAKCGSPTLATTWTALPPEGALAPWGGPAALIGLELADDAALRRDAVEEGQHHLYVRRGIRRLVGQLGDGLLSPL